MSIALTSAEGLTNCIRKGTFRKWKANRLQASFQWPGRRAPGSASTLTFVASCNDANLVPVNVLSMLMSRAALERRVCLRAKPCFS